MQQWRELRRRGDYFAAEQRQGAGTSRQLMNTAGKGEALNSNQIASMQEHFAEPDPLAKRETLELMRAYYRIADPRVRRRMFNLIKALAKVAG